MQNGRHSVEMAFLFESILVLAAVYVNGCDVNAPLPNIDAPIDMRQFNGTWYETVTSTDQISSGHFCCIFKDVEVNPLGFQAVVTYFYDHAEPRSFNLDYQTTQRGTYRQKTVEANQVKAKEFDENGNLDPLAAKTYKDTEWREFNMVGVPDKYIAYVQCTPEGWVIWLGTREKKLTTEQLIFIHNDLLKHGVSAPFRLGGCQNLNEK